MARKTATKRPVFVPYVMRKGMPVMLPLFGPGSVTREDAQARLDVALANPINLSGEVRQA